MLGTPDFIAPEQIANAQKADIRADIYSLGCTLYYLLSGRPPFQGRRCTTSSRRTDRPMRSRLNFVRPEVPAELAALVAKMMAKEPGRRFQSRPRSRRRWRRSSRSESSRAREQWGSRGESSRAAGLRFGVASRPRRATEAAAAQQSTRKTRQPGRSTWANLIEIKETERVGQAPADTQLLA